MPRNKIYRKEINKVIKAGKININIEWIGVKIGIRMITVKNLIIKILVYSAIKIKANAPLLYSVLNPETSSDSPSAKSNGLRFVSASVVIYHIKADIGNMRKTICGFAENKIKENVIIKNNTANKINVILTSYEIVCAILRRAPNREYLELALQPAPKVV